MGDVDRNKQTAIFFCYKKYRQYNLVFYADIEVKINI